MYILYNYTVYIICIYIYVCVCLYYSYYHYYHVYIYINIHRRTTIIEWIPTFLAPRWSPGTTRFVLPFRKPSRCRGAKGVGNAEGIGDAAHAQHHRQRWATKHQPKIRNWWDMGSGPVSEPDLVGGFSPPPWKMMELVRLDHHPNYWGK